MSGAVHIGLWQLAAGALLILVNGGLSLWLRLGLERKLLVASARTVVQLLLLGYVLLPIFEVGHAGLVVLLAVAMTALAAREALGRVKRQYRGAWLNGFVTLLLSAGATTFVGTAVLVGVDPWWTPRYFIPLLGMVLGNALTGISLGLDTALREVDEGRWRVELRLAFGATWWEAARPVAADALRAGMIPILNTMSVVGVVSIPGMMTGQLLGGTGPEQAARYQILILFMIAAATALGCVTAVLLGLRRVFDEHHRLRLDRLTGAGRSASKSAAGAGERGRGKAKSSREGG